jgi:dihydroflavonol-4-reductase
MQIAITGASGFIGRNLSHYLRERGYNVIALARSNEKAQALNGQEVIGRVADVTDSDSLKTAFKDVEVVIHLAALFTNPECTWNDYYQINVEGTRKLRHGINTKQLNAKVRSLPSIFIVLMDCRLL